MGTMPILVTDGGCQLRPTDGTNSEHGNNHGRLFIPNIGGSTQTKCTWHISLVVGKALITNNAYQAKLAKEHHQFPLRENQSEGANTRTCSRKQAIQSIICGSGKHVGWASERRGRPIFSRHPKIVPLFEIDVAEVVTPYVTRKEEDTVECKSCK